jgi:hypothetical protein
MAQSRGRGADQPSENDPDVVRDSPNQSPDSIAAPESSVTAFGAGSDEDEGVDDLSLIELTSFTANPATIEPWGGSVLSWQVVGPHVATLRVGGRTIPYFGQAVVRPTFQTTYGLSAQVGTVHRTLGSVTVDVDLASCRINNLLTSFIVSQLDFHLRKFVEDSQGDEYPLRFRLTFEGGQLRSGGPIITIDSEGIRFRLPMKARVNNRPDPTVDVHAHFTAEAAPEMPGPIISTGGRVVPVFHRLEVAIRFPRWISWAAPDMGDREAEARSAMRAGMEAFLNGLVPLSVPEGMRVHSLAFTDNDLRVRSCRDPLVDVVTN